MAKLRIYEALRTAWPILEQLPDGIHWSVAQNTGLQVQAATQEKVQAVRALFSGVIWKRTWEGGSCNWWEYSCVYEGLPVQIYACHEAPPQCTARYELRDVEKQITDAFHTDTVSEKVLVGWDCGGNGDAGNAEAQPEVLAPEDVPFAEGADDGQQRSGDGQG